MRIIDKRKDYYDNVIKGSTEPVWVRKEKVYSINDTIFDNKDRDYIIDLMRSSPNSIKPYNQKPSVFEHFVGVCGKMYCVFMAHKDENIMTSTMPSKIHSFLGYDGGGSTKSYRDYHILLKYGFGIRRFTDDWVDRWKKMWETDRFYDLFIKLDTPIIKFGWENRKLILTTNPILYNIGFQSVIDPWTMYQEIEMFIGNDLVKDYLGDFEMSDELKRDSKGFDNWSFKKRK